MISYSKSKVQQEPKRNSRYSSKSLHEQGGLSNTPPEWQVSKESEKLQSPVGLVPGPDYYRGWVKTITSMVKVHEIRETLWQSKEIVVTTRYKGFPMCGDTQKADIKVEGLDGIGGYSLVKVDLPENLDDNERENILGQIGYHLGRTKEQSEWFLINYQASKVQIELPGGYLGRFELWHNRIWLRWLRDQGVECSRFDLKFDDHQRRIPVEKMALARKDDRCGFKKSNVVGDFGELVATDDWWSIGNFTLYLGARKSEKCTRIYDARVKHQIEAIRYEVEYKGDTARSVLDAFLALESGTDYGQWICDVIISTVDFREHSEGNDRHLERRARLPWWQEYIDYVGEVIKVYVFRRASLLPAKIAWLKKSVAPSLAKVEKVFPGTIRDLREIGNNRLTDRDFKQIELWQDTYPIAS
jgi:hypothetical protein